MGKTELRGIKGFFSEYGKAEPPNSRPVQVEPRREPGLEEVPRQQAAAEKTSMQTPTRKPPKTVKARQGRPPGTKKGARERKAKATFYVNSDLMDFYRDWSWEQRCNVGQLVELALSDYKKRNASG